MNCETHHRQIQFICKSDSCYFLPLCSSCIPDHTPIHKNNELMPIAKAIQLARNNLDKQKQLIGQLLFPFERRRELTSKIEQQKKLLRVERDRLVKYIDDYISQEISKLTNQNRSIALSASDKDLENELKNKNIEISELITNYKRSPSALQRSLNFQLQSFEQKLGQRNSNFSSARFHFYSNTTHQIMLSKLQMVSESTSSRNFRKVMNQSTLYFLIDPKFNTSPRLFDFNAAKQKLLLYNSLDQQWFSVTYDGLPQQGSGIHDHQSDKFFWIGGVLKGKKTNSIMIYDYKEPQREKRFKQAKLKIARSSCMTAIVTTNYKRGIIIVGGLGEYGEALKQFEFLDFKTMETTLIGQTNFAVFSGTLAVYNHSTVLRLGGLCKNKGFSSIVEVVEKLDCQDAFYRFQNDKIEPRWSYVQLQLPKGDFFSKPKLFYANQAAIQINPNELFIFGGLDTGLSGSTESYLISVEQYKVQSRDIKSGNKGLQQRWTIRWVNEKPLISGDDFGGLKPAIWKQKLFSLQNIGDGEILTGQKRLIQFDMYQWFETDNIQPQ